MTRPADVVVIGGGIIGCAVAWELARRDAAVAVVERGTPGREATWAAGGMLSPLSEVGQGGPFLELGLASFARFPAFVRDIEEAAGYDVEFRRAGKLMLATDAAERAQLETHAGWLGREGVPFEWLEGDEARRAEPALGPAVVAGVFIERDHRVDSRRLGRAVWTAAERAGVEFRLGAAAVTVEPSGQASGRRHEVMLAGGGTIACDAVVVAAGCWSAEIVGLPRRVPVFPVRGQMAAVETVPPLFERVVMVPGCYLIPRGRDRVVIGATIERVGFRRATTPAGLASLFRAASRISPAIGAAPVAETWAGLRPGTPDDLPIIGEDPDVEGIYYATGHYRNGILLAPATADIVADLVVGKPPVLDPAAFSVRRFDPASRV